MSSFGRYARVTVIFSTEHLDPQMYRPGWAKLFGAMGSWDNPITVRSYSATNWDPEMVWRNDEFFDREKNNDKVRVWTRWRGWVSDGRSPTTERNLPTKKGPDTIIDSGRSEIYRG